MKAIHMANLMSFDLNLLRVLDALLQEGSTVKAGARVGLSQPAVSAALGRLRHALGDPLFIRRGSGLEATEYARQLQAPLSEVMTRIERLVAGPQTFDPARTDRTFRLSSTDFYAELLMPALAERLSREAPGLRVNLVDLIGDNYLEALDTYGVHMALLPNTETPDWVDSVPVHRSSFVLVARRGHPRLERAGVRPGETVPLDLFCDLGHVLMSPEGRNRGPGDDALARVGRERRVVMTMPFFSGVYRSVADSDLVALLPRQLARRIGAKANLDIYLSPVPITPALLIMAWPRRMTTDPAHAWLRQVILDLLGPLNADEAPLP
jgi:DNA-binding transcriptional LysR family regulator